MNSNQLKQFSRLGQIVLPQIIEEIAERGFVFDAKDVTDLGCCLEAFTFNPVTECSDFMMLLEFLMRWELVTDDEEPEAMYSMEQLRLRAIEIANSMTRLPISEETRHRISALRSLFNLH